MNCLSYFRTENELKSHEKKRFRGIEMRTEKKWTLEFKEYMKPDKMPNIIYTDIESLIRKIEGCANKSEKSSTTITQEHISSGYSMSTAWGFDRIENKHTLYRGKDRNKTFRDSLREHAKNLITFEKKKMSPLTGEELISHKYTEVCLKSLNHKKV